MVKVPGHPASTITTDPLSIDINVNIDVEGARHENRKIRSGYGLPQRRSRRDWGKKGEDDFDIAGRLWIRRRCRNPICQIGGGRIVLRAHVDWI